MRMLAHAVLGTEPRALCIVDKHSIKRVSVPAPTCPFYAGSLGVPRLPVAVDVIGPRGFNFHFLLNRSTATSRG